MTCPTCKGDGILIDHEGWGAIKCSHCGGGGTVDEKTCSHCGEPSSECSLNKTRRRI